VRWSSFLRELPRDLRAELPRDLDAFRWRSGSGQAKAWYGNPSLHYEVWVRPRLHVVELGLHFEADALTNARLLAAFHARAKELKRGLGTDARVEEWDKGWARVWEPISLEAAEDDLRGRVRSRLVDYMRILEPMLREELPSDVRWVLSAPRASRSAR
jgi:hypothetical protein